MNQGTLFAIAFDPDRMETHGPANPILNDVAYAPTFGYAQLDVSRTGTLVYRRNEAGGQFTAGWLDAAGRAEPLPLMPGNYAWPRISPDGRRLALSAVESGTTSIWIYDMETNRTARSGSHAKDYSIPIWATDGSALVVGGLKGMAWLSAENLENPKRLTRSSGIQIPWSFAPDGSRLAFFSYELNSSTAFDLWTIPVRTAGDSSTVGSPELFLGSAAIETYPAFSPDGQWLAYASNESGTLEVYVRTFPDNGTKVRVSDAGGLMPKWSPAGRELFYRTPDQRIMIADYVAKDGLFAPSKPRVWSNTRLADTGVIANYDLSPDGKRILALMPAEKKLRSQQTQNHVTFVVNFLDEVRRRMRLDRE